MKTRILLPMAFLAPLAGWAVDQVPMDVKLGLWESTVTTQISMPQLPPELLSKLPPEQRARMQAAQGRGGVSRTDTTKHCLTQETLQEQFSFGNNKTQTCKRTLVTSTNTKQVVHIECTSAAMNTTSDLQFEAVNRENIKGSVVMSSGQGGRGENAKMEFTSKWVAADCGELGKKN